MVYLDNAATTQMSQKVLDAVESVMAEDYGNPGTIYDIGKRAKDIVEESRKRVAHCIGASESNIVFTSGGSESNAMVFFGIADWMLENGKTTVVVSAIEHESVLRSAEAVCMKYGFHLYKIGVDRNGFVDMAQLSGILCTGAVGLVSIMYMNNEIGTVQSNIKEIADACHYNGAFFHTDCVQALSSVPIDVGKIGCDFLSVSSHKIHGPKGVGALYISDRALNTNAIAPLIYGGAGQEFGLRGGTENVPGVYGFGVACEDVELDLQGDVYGLFRGNKYVFVLRCAFCRGMVSQMRKCEKQPCISLNGCEEKLDGGKASNGKIMSITVQGIDNEALAMMLNERGICVGTGSACRSMEVTPSHVLKAIGLSDTDAMSTIRVSFSRFNTPEEVQSAAAEIVKCSEALRKIGQAEYAG